MWQIARLQSIMGSGLAPLTVYYLMVAGGLSALNKISEAEQKELERLGLERKLRPVNSGCGIAKTPLRCAIQSPSAKRVAKDLEPFQLGYAAAAGPQTKCAIARALFEAGYFISLQDAVNAFNTLCRQAMLDAVAPSGPKASHFATSSTASMRLFSTSM